MTAVYPGAGIARVLTAKGAIQDPAWHRAVLAVPRDRFVPEAVWAQDGDGWYTAIPVTDPDPQRWLTEDVSIVTQVDDGRPRGDDGRGYSPSSSISQPSLVVAMLEAMGARDGDTVLEIGTGTGYNTALLCERLGAENVTSIEVDPGVAEAARERLHRLGYKPRLIVGDGAHPPEGRFDRVLATVAVTRIPAAWVAAAAPGGTIVAPWAPGAGFAESVLVRLEGGHGEAAGRVVGDAAFMLARDQRPPVDAWRTWVDEDDPDAVTGSMPLNPRCVADRDPGWSVVLGWSVPGLGYAAFEAAPDNHPAAGEATVYVFDRAGSWAVAEYKPPGGPYATRRAGPRDLWAEIAAARTAWSQSGSPARDRLGLTVTATGEHHLWVDTPENALTCIP
ncbi:methyltransferase domain-containing protein [Streptomonospora sp. S1-112]|uniref:Protein-L-isoaspartate O-methyltransferase n=1 Tax=Streptomonospora mangrovi TaxID=2883123 RepID=A0A9X3NIP7_9ACTN|nr:methyltransferase domain-containing protein [Streptomonospora mangrovi]MDA0564529.1 methyltransferase domain-containing protein [Streptomonospora mangrovi]